MLSPTLNLMHLYNFATYFIFLFEKKVMFHPAIRSKL